MKRAPVVLTAVLVLAAGALFGMGRTATSAVKTCRADAQGFAEENASFQAEYDRMFGATTLGQRPISELLDRDKELMGCIETDPKHDAEYRAVLYRNGFIEGNRFFKYMLDTKQLQDFAQWERGQQATQLAKYRENTH
jgi:hypothetical protein